MVKKQTNIDLSILYGSWVNGQSNEYSDIDLAVFSPDFGKNKLLELQLLSKLSWAVDESIEAIPYPVDKLNNPNPSSFIYEILNTGKIVYESASN